jgi:histidine triad (HIT) family protein
MRKSICTYLPDRVRAVESDPECLFCRIVAGDVPAQRVYDDELTVAFMDINPTARGHVLVVPRAHASDLLDIGADDLAACMATAQHVAGWQLSRLNADGVNLLQSTGRAASQVIFHFHVHVIPRYEGDGVVNPLQRGPGDRDEIAAVAAQLRGD